VVENVRESEPLVNVRRNEPSDAFAGQRAVLDERLRVERQPQCVKPCGSGAVAQQLARPAAWGRPRVVVPPAAEHRRSLAWSGWLPESFSRPRVWENAP